MAYLVVVTYSEKYSTRGTYCEKSALGRKGHKIGEVRYGTVRYLRYGTVPIELCRNGPSSIRYSLFQRRSKEQGLSTVI
jgi:hypothetical protein